MSEVLVGSEVVNSERFGPGVFLGGFGVEEQDIRFDASRVERDLFRVGHVRKPIVPQDVGEVPGFVDELLAIVRHIVSEFIPKHTVRRNQFHGDSTVCETRFEKNVSHDAFPDRRYIA